MALRAADPDTGPSLPEKDRGLITASADEVVPIPGATVAHLVCDVPGWPLWQPGVVAAERLEGPPAGPGMMCRLRLGTPRLSLSVVTMLMARRGTTTVFAGGGRWWRFIEVTRVIPLDDASTAVGRTVDIELGGALRWGGSLVRSCARRHLRRSLRALT